MSELLLKSNADCCWDSVSLGEDCCAVLFIGGLKKCARISELESDCFNRA
jgi:hypothetical protein